MGGLQRFACSRAETRLPGCAVAPQLSDQTPSQLWRVLPVVLVLAVPTEQRSSPLAPRTASARLMVQPLQEGRPPATCLH